MSVVIALNFIVLSIKINIIAISYVQCKLLFWHSVESIQKVNGLCFNMMINYLYQESNYYNLARKVTSLEL